MDTFRSPDRARAPRNPSASPLRARQGSPSARKQSPVDTSKPLPPDPPRKQHTTPTDKMNNERRSSSSHRRHADPRPSTSREVLQPRYYNDRRPAVDHDSAVNVSPRSEAVRKETLLPEELRALASKTKGVLVKTMPEDFDFDEDRLSHAFPEDDTRGRSLSRDHGAAVSDDYRLFNLSAQSTIHIPAEAERLARMYHALLRDQSIDSASASDDDDDDDDDTRTAMRAVPQPLFHNPRQLSEARTAAYRQRLLVRGPDHADERDALLPIMLSPLSNTLLYTPLRDDRRPRTPLLGRFASPPPPQRPDAASRFGAVKSLIVGAGASARQTLLQHARRPSGEVGHVDWAAVRGGLERLADPERVRQTLGRVAEIGIVGDIVEMHKGRARNRKRADLKKMIRVVPNV